MNFESFKATLEGKPFEGMALRLFDPKRRLWSIYWADSNTGVLDKNPVVGSFEGTLGKFYVCSVSRQRKQHHFDSGERCMTKAKLGTFDDLVAELPQEIETIARAARKQILEVHPDAIEVVRLGYRAATYGFGSKMSEGHTFVSPQTAYVNLGFPFGTSLFDPQRLLEGTGKNMRHVKLRSVAGVTRTRKLVAAAVDERRKALGLT